MKVDVQVEATLFDGGEYDDDKVEEQIIAQAANRLTKTVTQEALDIMRESVLEELKTRMDVLFAEIIDQPLQETNRWGESKGEPTTIRSLILKSADVWLNEKVDPKTGREANRYHDDKTCSRAEYAAKQVVLEVAGDMLKAEMKLVQSIAKAELSELKTALIAHQKK